MTKVATITAQQKWEYTTMTRVNDAAFLGELRVLGREGWELVSVQYYKDAKANMAWTGFLKRPDSGQAVPAAEQQKAAEVAVQSAHKTAAGSPDAKGFDLSDGEFNFKTE